MFGSKTPVWKVQGGFSWETLEGLIWSISAYRELERSAPLYSQLTVCANNGSLLNAQQSNAIAHLDIQIWKLNRPDPPGIWFPIYHPTLRYVHSVEQCDW